MSVKAKEEELTEFKREFYLAAKRRDRSTLQKMIHDGFIFLDPDGRIVDKDECVQTLTDPGTYLADNFKRTEKEVAISADGKTVTEVADVELSGKLKGVDLNGLYINTATYVVGPSGWQLIQNTWQPGQSCPGCCGSMTVQKKCAVCGREGADGLLAAH
jgi:hypothetical protein